MLKKILLTFWMLISVSAQAESSVDLSDPYKMVHQVADQTFARISKDQQLIKQDQNHLRTIVVEELLPYIDYKYAAYKILGKNLRKTSKQQRDEFVAVFKDYMVNTYAGVFTLYNNQKVEFDPAKPLTQKKIAQVGTRIIQDGKPDIRILFKVKRNKKGEWRAFDMVAEGISLLDSKRSEFNSVIRKEGIEYVIDLLKKKSQLPVEFRKDDVNGAA